MALFNGPFDQMKSEKERKEEYFYLIKKEREKMREKLFEDIEENLKTEDKKMLFLERKFNNQLIGIKN